MYHNKITYFTVCMVRNMTTRHDLYLHYIIMGQSKGHTIHSLHVPCAKITISIHLRSNKQIDREVQCLHVYCTNNEK